MTAVCAVYIYRVCILCVSVHVRRALNVDNVFPVLYARISSVCDRCAVCMSYAVCIHVLHESALCVPGSVCHVCVARKIRVCVLSMSIPRA